MHVINGIICNKFIGIHVWYQNTNFMLKTKTELLEKIQLDFIEFTGKSLDERKRELPLTNPEQIKAIIWNLLSSNKLRKQISYSDYSKMLDTLIDLLKNP